MISASIDPASARELDQLAAALRLYLPAVNVSTTEALHRKGEDLLIQLFRGYRAQRWKGSRKGSARSVGIAFAEMRRRAKSGRGITFTKQITTPSKGAPVETTARRKLRGPDGRLRSGSVPVVLSTYHRLVWSELARRQGGIGVLAVSFLTQRRRQRYSTSQARYVRLSGALLRANKIAASREETVKSRTGETLARVTLAPNSFVIEGYTSGLNAIGNRYGIIAGALRAVRKDMQPYLARKYGEGFQEAAALAGLRVT